MIRIVWLFVRRLWLPLVVFAGFSVMCMLVYRRLEGLSWQDALFWMIQPHAIDAHRVHNSTKLFSLFVYGGVFAFQIWVAERVAVTIFNRQGMEAWRTMVNDVSIEKIRDHFIICGYGQVGRTVVDQLNRLKIPFVLIETNEGLCRELLKEKVLIIQGDAKRHDVLQSAGIERARTPQNIEPGALVKVNVRNHDGEIVLREQRQSLGAGRGQPRRITFRLQQRHNGLGHGRIVLDDQDLRPRLGFLRRAHRRVTGQPVFGGRQKPAREAKW